MLTVPALAAYLDANLHLWENVGADHPHLPEADPATTAYLIRRTLPGHFIPTIVLTFDTPSHVIIRAALPPGAPDFRALRYSLRAKDPSKFLPRLCNEWLDTYEELLEETLTRQSADRRSREARQGVMSVLGDSAGGPGGASLHTATHRIDVLAHPSSHAVDLEIIGLPADIARDLLSSLRHLVQEKLCSPSSSSPPPSSGPPGSSGTSGPPAGESPGPSPPPGTNSKPSSGLSPLAS